VEAAEKPLVYANIKEILVGSLVQQKLDEINSNIYFQKLSQWMLMF